MTTKKTVGTVVLATGLATATLVAGLALPASTAAAAPAATASVTSTVTVKAMRLASAQVLQPWPALRQGTNSAWPKVTVRHPPSGARSTSPAAASEVTSLETKIGSRPMWSARRRWLGRSPPAVMPRNEASTVYCAWVRPSGATARSTAAPHRIASRQTIAPVVGCRVDAMETIYKEIVAMANTSAQAVRPGGGRAWARIVQASCTTRAQATG